MEKFGLGHPKSSELAIIFANMCNAAAKQLLGFEGRKLRIAKKLLDIAQHVLRLDSSYLLFMDNRKTLALTYNNRGCLLQKQSRYQVAINSLHTDNQQMIFSSLRMHTTALSRP